MDARPWLQNYPKGLPANIDLDKYPNLNAYLKEALEKYSKKPAFYSMGKSLTYGEIDKMADYILGYFLEFSAGQNRPVYLGHGLEGFDLSTQSCRHVVEGIGQGFKLVTGSYAYPCPELT